MSKINIKRKVKHFEIIKSKNTFFIYTILHFCILRVDKKYNCYNCDGVLVDNEAISAKIFQ
ncbi:MAG: hypothetical protein FD181_932 [Prolixibacteraceae bacterium]|nr:MAG: hypothetical protein FD181_932 [Prolixibacteraceae bacterium]